MKIKELLFEATLVSILNRILQNKPLPENTQQRKEIVDLVNKIVLRIKNYPDSIERFTIERIPFDDIKFEDLFETAQEIIKFIFNRGPNVSDFHKDWLFRKWLSRDIDNLHDAVEFKYDLLTFDANKAHIPQGQRDINQLEPRQVREIVREFDISQQDRDDKKFEEDWGQAQSDILYKDPFGEFVLYSPQTQFAACVLGHDTDWCTAYGYEQGKWSQRTHNQFTEYNQQGPLYIFDFPKHHTKFQIHLGSKEDFRGSRYNQEYKNKDNEDLSKSEKTLLKEAIGKLPIKIILEFLEQSIDLDLIPNLENKVKNPSEPLKRIKNPNATIQFLSKYPKATEVLLDFAIQIVEPLVPIWKESLTRTGSSFVDVAEKMLAAIKNEDIDEMKILNSKIQKYNDLVIAIAHSMEPDPRVSDESKTEKILSMWRGKRVGESLRSLSRIAEEFYSRNESSQDLNVSAQNIATTVRALIYTVSGAYNTKDFKMPLTDELKNDFQSALINLLKEKGL